MPGLLRNLLEQVGRGRVTPGRLPSLCHTQVLYPSLKEVKERTCQSPAGLRFSHPHPKPEDTQYTQRSNFKNPDTWEEIMKYGILVSGKESITQKGKQKEIVRTSSHRSPNVIIKFISLRLFRETH